jgi:magnesium chelatase family protein
VIASVRSATILGAEGRLVTVEVHVGKGLPSFTIVGLPDETCRESRDRVRAAVMSSELFWPSARITVNLAPSGERKVGSALDLAIAVGVLVASGQVPGEAAERHGFLGELGLDGSVRAVPGVAPMAAVLDGVAPVVPVTSVREAAVTAGEGVRSIDRLDRLVCCLRGEEPWPDPPAEALEPEPVMLPDLAEVRGQPAARRALEIAAAGGHHLLLVGPPGAGKTMLAQRLPGLLPALSGRDAVEVTMVHSAAGVRLPPGGLVRHPPFRAPHHSSSLVSLVGGGTAALRPGEISLASGGVLFLDEMGEFAPSVLDALRQPLEEGVVRLARARAAATLPARFLLVGSTNPCPCGGGAPGDCECDDTARARYLRRLSGPLLDRFDLRVGVGRPEVDDLLATSGGEPTSVVAARVAAARRLALARSGHLNAALAAGTLDELAPLTSAARTVLRRELERGRLTGRGYHRVRRVARTVADLAGDAGAVDDGHVAMALLLRTRMIDPRRGGVR